MRSMNKCLHLRMCAAALLLAVMTTFTGCGRSDAVMGMLLTDGISGKQDDLALSFGAETDDGTGTEANDLAVYVCGAVMSPGVYYLPEGARACDALSMAGGFGDNADTEFVNLAGKVEDGQILRFYTLEQTSPGEQTGQIDNTVMPGQEALETGAGVNINLDSYDQLITLPGIGDVKAKAIITYREQHGPFASIEQVKEVKGISDSLFEKISELITV